VVTAIAALLDASNLRLSVIELPGGGNADAALFLTAATRVIREIAGYFRVELDPASALRLSRAEFEVGLEQLAKVEIQLSGDRDAAWERFAQRRARYEAAVRGLATIVDAPPAPWASDGLPPLRRPNIFLR